jgi:hypothetical protein
MVSFFSLSLLPIWENHTPKMSGGHTMRLSLVYFVRSLGGDMARVFLLCFTVLAAKKRNIITHMFANCIATLQAVQLMINLSVTSWV